MWCMLISISYEAGSAYDVEGEDGEHRVYWGRFNNTSLIYLQKKTANKPFSLVFKCVFFLVIFWFSVCGGVFSAKQMIQLWHFK